MDISVVVTAHAEGLYLYKTLLSIERSLLQLPAGVVHEIIIGLDNANPETERVARLWCKKNKATRLLTVSFGDPASNRNHAIREAAGTYVAVLDGDDLVSEGWISRAYDTLKDQSKEVILRPAYHMQFGYDEHHYTVWKMRSSADKATDAVQMAYWNLWTNCLFATKRTLERMPFRVVKNGFGFEDYLFATETIAADIPNLIVPQTALFYRRRENSTSSLHVDTILPYSPLFDIQYFQSLPLPTSTPRSKEGIKQKLQRNVKRGYRFAFDTAKKIGPLNRTMAPSVRSILYRKNKEKVGEWFIHELEKINTIENQIYPTKGQVALMQFHPLSFQPYENSFGVMYQRLCHQLSGDRLDYLFLAPALSGRGGTEKLIANYIKAIKKAHPDWKIGLLSTHPFNQLTVDYFEGVGVDLLDFGAITAGVGDYEKNIIWSRLLVQSGVKRLHIVNNEYWYRWLSRHKALMTKNDYIVNVSLFMREYAHEPGRVLTFADPHISEVWETINTIFTDNQRVIDDALTNNAFDPERLVVHYQPQDFSEITVPKEINTKAPLRVLWASRISYQKRPDIVKRVADMLGDEARVDAYGIIEKQQFSEHYFADSRVRYRGGFRGISSIDTSQYDVYLYTSQTDGVPNILMEVAAAGLPIVASNAGGVGEFVRDNEAGKLVEIDDVEGYVAALRELHAHPEQARSYAEAAQQLITTQHAWDRFEDLVAKDIT